MNLLEYMEKVSNMDAVTKKELGDTMSHGSDKEKEEIWKKINELGGYDALED